MVSMNDLPMHWQLNALRGENCHNNEEVLYRCQFPFYFECTQYREELNDLLQLSVTILDAHGLPAMDRNGMSDPYVKLCILPERKQKYETKIIRNSLNPVYNETFLFTLPFNELQSKTLLLTVYDYDRLSKDDKMGQLSIPLESIDFGTTTEICRYLCKPENDDDVSFSAFGDGILMRRRGLRQFKAAKHFAPLIP
ncbi:C2 domain protein [Oesophagostomum dentatum]|uniref:C2 domain protein n=1 Tax=Oesophagostomum dentatum TaxID=61180 RepID=A0A0B1TGZ3_OESDE|nr:C2 domain protein [Oesophagostomum dentatum]